MCNPSPVGLTKQRPRGQMQQDMVKGGGIVQRKLMTALRSYIGYPRYSFHSIAYPPTQLVQRPVGVNHPWFSLLDRHLLDQPRSLRTGSAPNIAQVCDTPPRDEGCISGVNEACLGWRDAISKYRSLEITRNIRESYGELGFREWAHAAVPRDCK